MTVRDAVLSSRYSEEVHMKTFTHNNSFKSFALILFAFICIIFIGFMPRINAESETFIIYDEGHEGNYVSKYKTQNDMLAYCYDADLAPARKDGTAFQATPQEVEPEVSYLLLHGYPTTTYIHGTNFSTDDAFLITQVALWMQRGFMDENGVLTAKAGDVFSTTVGEKPYFVKNNSAAILDSARFLVHEANEKSPTSEIPAEMRAKLYIPEHDAYQRMLVAPNDPWGRLKLLKKLEIPATLENTESYDLDKVEFEIYKDDKPTGKSFKINMKSKNDLTYTTYDKDDTSHDYIDLAPGFYKIVEKNVPEGFEVQNEDSIYVPAYTGPDSTTTYTIVNRAKVIQTDVLIKKVEKTKETIKPLAGAQFEVKHSDGMQSRTWILTSDDHGEVKLDAAHLISGDELYASGDEAGMLPLGTLTIKEIKAPAGYALQDKLYEFNLTELSQESKEFKTLTIENEPVRSNLKFEKKDGNSQESLAYVPFRLTNKETGESHIIFTDAKGYFDSSTIKHTERTNANDALNMSEVEKGLENPGNTQCGLWFSEPHSTPVQDDKGSLVYGTYILEEIRGDTNRGYELINLTFDVHNEGVVDLGEILNWKVGLETNLSAKKESEEQYVLTDHLTYTNLPENNEYLVRTTFVVIGENGDPEQLLVNGEEFSQTTKLISNDRQGSVDIQCEIPKEYLMGKTVVAYEEIYKENELLVSHKNPHDKNQTVTFESEKIIPKTGFDDRMPLVFGSAVSICAIALIYIYSKRRNVW